MQALKLSQIGNSFGVILPKEVVARLKVQKGDTLFLTESPEGYVITPYDPAIAEQLEAGREFMRENLHLLTVHHKDHNHDNNPLDGSNWENLCIYCHDNEHSRYLDHVAGAGGETGAKVASATQKPFSNLKDLLKPKK